MRGFRKNKLLFAYCFLKICVCVEGGGGGGGKVVMEVDKAVIGGIPH